MNSPDEDEHEDEIMDVEDASQSMSQDDESTLSPSVNLDDDEEGEEDSSSPPEIVRPLPESDTTGTWTSTSRRWYRSEGGRITRGARLRGRWSSSTTLRVFPVIHHEYFKQDWEIGGKVILPPSVLSRLTRRSSQLQGPMLFKVTHEESGKDINCGVLEFTAKEGECYMPSWRMRSIEARQGDQVIVDTITADVGRYALFQPQSVDFLDITNPAALLESWLRNLACITKGEILAIPYNNKMYELKVLNTKPGDILNIIECDMNVDFAPPVGFSDGNPIEEFETVEEQEIVAPGTFVPFAGTGHKINNKPVEETPSSVRRNMPSRGQPDFEWKVGRITLSRKIYRKVSPKEKNSTFEPFQGAGSSLGK